MSDTARPATSSASAAARPGRRTRAFLSLSFGALALAALACKRTPASSTEETPGSLSAEPLAKSTPDAGPPRRPGMVWVPAGTLRAGTPVDRVPRVPDEELPGVPIEMGGFYIDQLPWPNEPGAIPTTNVTRDEASALCASKGKRLCTELEWERACKGEGNGAYENGDSYRAATCGTGASPEEAARRPTGEHAQCKSSFGVSDMHGGVWEWTESAWGRGNKDPALGVLRGGNAMAGELVGRCANGIGRPIGKKSPTMGLRCCAGPRNEQTVDLPLHGTPSIETVRKLDELHAAWEPALRASIGTAANHPMRAWRWVPVANEELFIIVGCTKLGTPSCSVAVGRQGGDSPYVIAHADVGTLTPDVLRLGDVRHLRIRGLDPRGTFGRDVTYVYGNVDIAEQKRP